MYKVIRDFIDSSDQHSYAVGDIYPAHGVSIASKSRLEELSSNHNVLGVPVIEDTSETLSEVTGGVEEVKADVDSPKKSEAKGKPRRRQGKNA